jgi:hypothetical protein
VDMIELPLNNVCVWVTVGRHQRCERTYCLQLRCASFSRVPGFKPTGPETIHLDKTFVVFLSQLRHCQNVP